ncbi:uncharacterized protein [Henckelia pumila]|uniref:uncharacterized protein n=1 Tax=Henckelia pumila TaxID=405737 RepID=UPI003C6DCA51
MQTNRDRAENRWVGSFCPKIQKIIDKTFEKIGDYIPIKADDYHYQISGFDLTQYSVDLEKQTYGCRKWELSGIPCRHALSAIDAQGFDYYNYTQNCYRLDTYKLVYAFAIMPVNGRNEWKHTNMIPPLPPNPDRPVGRPKKARKRERDEGEQEKNKKKQG